MAAQTEPHSWTGWTSSFCSSCDSQVGVSTSVVPMEETRVTGGQERQPDTELGLFRSEERSHGGNTTFSSQSHVNEKTLTSHVKDVPGNLPESVGAAVNTKTTDGGVQPHTLLPHSSGAGEVQGQGAGRFGVWSGSASWFAAAVFLVCPHMAKREITSQFSFLIIP